jgi:hypothetical protein
MTPLQSAIIGGLGGMTPLIAAFAAGEYENVMTADFNYLLGYGLRSVALFFVGAVFVWLHTDARSRYSAFRLGMTAPAIIATMLSTASANAGETQTTFSSVGSEILVASIDTIRSDALASNVLPPDVFFDKECTVLDGLIGRKCK